MSSLNISAAAAEHLGLGARDLMGYCLVMLPYSSMVICGAFYFLG
jgi:short-chain fatty acids transporter